MTGSTVRPPDASGFIAAREIPWGESPHEIISLRRPRWPLLLLEKQIRRAFHCRAAAVGKTLDHERDGLLGSLSVAIRNVSTFVGA